MVLDTLKIPDLQLTVTLRNCIKRFGSLLVVGTLIVGLYKMYCCGGSRRIVVKTSKGAVRGSKMKTKQGKKIFAFRGIPYGKPPTGELRFRRSEPVEPWTGVLNCQKESPKSFQPNVLAPESCLREGGEDCLYLNVYTKDYLNVGDGPVNRDEVNLLPVVVFLHGGAFVVGSCESFLYGPQVLLDRDIVLVGVNYRLGALGFLSLENDEAPGNLGLHDQYLALQWVQENISRFGGDPQCVTLMGESAGAMSAFCHMVSPMSAGLFHRVIALSGTVSNTLLHNDRRPRNYALSLAIRLGYKGDHDDNTDLLRFLQAQKAVDIVKSSIMFMDWDYAFPMPWVPVIDDYSSQPFLPHSLKSAVTSGSLNNVPVIVGLCRDEGNIMTAPYHKEAKRWQLLTKDWDQWAPLIFFNRERELIQESDKEAAASIASFYFGDNVNMETLDRSEENLAKLGRIYSMSYFYSGADTDIRVLAEAGCQVFPVILSHPPNFSLMDIFRLTLPQLIWSFTAKSVGCDPYPSEHGVCHGDDLNYLFPMSPFPDAVVTHDQSKVRTLLLDLVTSFSTRGRPSYTDHTDGLNTVLEPMTTQHGLEKYFNISPNASVITDEKLQEELAFWNKIMEKSRSRDLVNIMPTALYRKIACQRL